MRTPAIISHALATHHATYIVSIDFQLKKWTARRVTYISGGVLPAHTAWQFDVHWDAGPRRGSEAFRRL
ncbi:MAG TPA: hypothetical protein VF395_14700, partial [Polyangiaceae bacterium]